MAGFAGHAVFPTLYRDMNDPKRYDQMVDITYALTILVYVAMAAAGYLMFGSETLQEVSDKKRSRRFILLTYIKDNAKPCYHTWLLQMAQWPGMLAGGYYPDRQVRTYHEPAQYYLWTLVPESVMRRAMAQIPLGSGSPDHNRPSFGMRFRIVYSDNLSWLW